MSTIAQQLGLKAMLPTSAITARLLGFGEAFDVLNERRRAASAAMLGPRLACHDLRRSFMSAYVGLKVAQPRRCSST